MPQSLCHQLDTRSGAVQLKSGNLFIAKRTLEYREFVHASAIVTRLVGKAPIADHKLAELEPVYLNEQIFSHDRTINIVANTLVGGILNDSESVPRAQCIAL